MRIFISYAHEDHEVAEQIHQALLGEGHEVFWDRARLATGHGYHTRIRQEVERCELLVFLLSPESVSDGSYCRTELKYARDRWPSPEGRVLPVLVRTLGQARVPPYIGSATFLQPEGNIAAEVLDRVAELAGEAAHEPAVPQRTATPVAPQAPHAAAGPQVLLGAVGMVHNLPLPTPSPGQAMPGMRILVPVTVTGAIGQVLQLVARFQFVGGPMLQAHVMEHAYRDAGGLVATGTMRRPVASDPESFTESNIVIPYPVLNLAPTNYTMVHPLLAIVTAYLNEVPAAQSVPTPFQLRW